MAAADKNMPGPATFVLVHGAWGGGFVYAPVARILRGRGHLVYTPTLTGVGERSHLMQPGIDIGTHVQDIVNVFKWEEIHDAVLVGHSYGGMVISGVADQIPERISSIVYLDAFLPEDGQAIIDLRVTPEIIQQFVAARDQGEQTIPFPPEFARDFKIPEEDLWKYMPHPLACFVEPVRLTGTYRSIKKKTFVWATGVNQGFKHFYERTQDDPSWNTEAIAAGHMVQLEAPEQTAEILEAAI